MDPRTRHSNCIQSLLSCPHFIISVSFASFVGGDADENAQALRDVLVGGEFTNAKRDSILLNAGDQTEITQTLL